MSVIHIQDKVAQNLDLNDGFKGIKINRVIVIVIIDCLYGMQDHFEAQLKEAGDNLVIVDFYATWCGPCKMISPELEKMASSEFTDVMFLKVDVDENEDIAAEYNVTAMPTFIFFKNGNQV